MAARPEPIAKVKADGAVDIDAHQLRGASVSETACIAAPILVWLINVVRAIIITMVAAIVVRIASPVTRHVHRRHASPEDAEYPENFSDAEPKISSAIAEKIAGRRSR